jgi:hypothetical protein
MNAGWQRNQLQWAMVRASTPHCHAQTAARVEKSLLYQETLGSMTASSSKPPYGTEPGFRRRGHLRAHECALASNPQKGIPSKRAQLLLPFKPRRIFQ